MITIACVYIYIYIYVIAYISIHILYTMNSIQYLQFFIYTPTMVNPYHAWGMYVYVLI